MKHPRHLVTDEATSQRMSKTKLKRGIAEKLLSSSLWEKGFRYKLNTKDLPGSPDIAILKYKIAVFIDGEFWHGYDWENKKGKLIRNKDYWIEKIEENIARDARVDRELSILGWTPIHFWSKEVQKNLDDCVQEIMDIVFSQTVYEL